MTTETFLVRANHHIHQVITCSTVDQLLKALPVSVVFFYRESVTYNILKDSLAEILSDFSIFAGVLKNINNNLCIDCNNQGVSFSITQDNCTVDQIIDELPNIETEKLVNKISLKEVIHNQSPVMNIKLTYLSCGGMVIGICWHHSIGDMHTFMQLMKAWSSSVSKEDYVSPLIVEERDKYLQENLKANNNNIPGVRYLEITELFRLMFYRLVQARNKLRLQFYFSENELNNMKQSLSEKTDKLLSNNDVLCAHLFSIISELDKYDKSRSLSIVVNYRSKAGLQQNVLGNFISTLNILTNEKVDSSQLAQELRTAIDNFQQLHMNFFPTQNYIKEKGGIKKINRFILKGIDPLRRALLVTNWSNFGVYHIIFGQSKPFYFGYFGDSPIPWLSSITEGFSNTGLIYSISLPRKLAMNLIQSDSLQKIHRYRPAKEVMPEIVEKSKWLL